MTIVRTWIEDFSSSAERSSALSGSYSRVELGSALQILIGRFSTSPVIASSSRNLQFFSLSTEGRYGFVKFIALHSYVCSMRAGIPSKSELTFKFHPTSENSSILT